MSETAVQIYDEERAAGALHRNISWTHAVWVATGVPALVLFSIGGLAATVGTPSWLVWIVSIVIGSCQMFTYAEVAGMFAHKSGGSAVSGAMAWLPYGRVFPALSVWTYFLGWTPVVAIGAAIASGYILTALLPAGSHLLTWQLTLIDLGFIQDQLSIRINLAYIVSAIILVAAFIIQHGGLMQASRMQMIMAVASLLPLGVIGFVPLISGHAQLSNLFPLVPLAHDAAGKLVPGSWNMAGISVFAGGLFIAGWSTYGIETCLVYTGEFRNPKTDTFKAALGTSLLCLVFYAIVPISFQGALGLKGLLDPGIYDGSGVGAAMAHMVGLSGWLANVIVAMLVLTLVLSIMTAIAGSSRTLYQASVDGFLPRFLSRTNAHGSPIPAMWTELGFNLALLLVSNNVFLLALSNVSYLAFIFLNLQAGWIHRMDRPDWSRPFRSPTVLLALGAGLGFFDIFLIGMGANAYGSGVLVSGLVTIVAIIPVFLYRHYIQDRGVFPAALAADLQPGSDVAPFVSRAGVLPYVALLAGGLLIALGAHLAA